MLFREGDSHKSRVFAVQTQHIIDIMQFSFGAGVLDDFTWYSNAIWSCLLSILLVFFTILRSKPTIGPFRNPYLSLTGSRRQ